MKWCGALLSHSPYTMNTHTHTSNSWDGVSMAFLNRVFACVSVYALMYKLYTVNFSKDSLSLAISIDMIQYHINLR